jgi:hypothetical protein
MGDTMSKQTVERRVFMGIGDAVLRLIHVEKMYADGIDPGAELVAERDLIVEALNQQYQLDLGMDCDLDGIPDSIDDSVNLLTQAAQTSCCRIAPSKGSRASRTTSSRKTPASRVEPLPKPVEEESVEKSLGGKYTAPKKGFLSSLFGSNDEEK